MNTDSKKYDMSALQLLSDGDEKFFREMVLLFLQSTAKSLQELNTAAQNGNFAQAGAIAHKMKGPANHLGAAEFSEILNRIESLAEQKPANGADIVNLAEQAVNNGQLLMKEISADTGITA